MFHHDDDPQGSSGQMWTCRCSCYSNCVLPQGEPGRLYQMFMTINVIITTRSYAALRAADLDWIFGPGYSPGG